MQVNNGMSKLILPTGQIPTGGQTPPSETKQQKSIFDDVKTSMQDDHEKITRIFEDIKKQGNPEVKNPEAKNPEAKNAEQNKANSDQHKTDKADSKEDNAQTKEGNTSDNKKTEEENARKND